ncbi:pentapeptide repeat-containing protein [Streptomyces sp. NRRL B-3648]|uniref:pentapeptide repeat-containing protein n=1 Tax=Streptomyces sp. NRRL B-3648 TaxID=1519493 RepID=UPI000A6687B0|nr:pentapeptide repeat-containing protein [Streptomyces sp. NRRL B-3648]
MTDDEREQHVAALRGLLYLACPDSPAVAITATAEAIAQHTVEAPDSPVPQAAHLNGPRRPSVVDPLKLADADLAHALLDHADLAYANLRGASLRAADLTGADLTRADLTGADLTGARLHRARLSYARLPRLDLSGVELSGADLSGADLGEADLTGADLSGANLHGVFLEQASLAGADLTDATLTNARLNGTRFEHAIGVRLPAGAIWDLDTRWPAAVASLAAEVSVELRPGVYLVPGDDARDRSRTARP